MQESSRRGQGVPTELPPSAPLVRITAGAGSPAQKTWNLRRPLTLIGSRRPAGIVLHGREVSKAHCVIVNTGTDVLLKDLHTRGGTFRNKEPVDLIALSDGDVIKVGNTTLQIAIQIPQDSNDDSGCDLDYADPRRFPTPLLLALEHTERTWRIEDAVTLIGRHEAAAVRLDHEDVSERHAVLFRYGFQPALFDLGSRTGLAVQGEPCTLAVLSDGDRLGFGPLQLRVQWESPAARPRTAQPNPHPEPIPINKPSPELVGIAGKLSQLQQNIGDSWDRLNCWTGQQEPSVSDGEPQQFQLEARKAALDAKDATLRGYMHDVTRYHDELAARERELAGEVARMQARRDELTSAEHAHKIRQDEIDKRSEELKRREHVLAQRWARLSGLKCPNCGEAVITSASEAPAS